jgi:hypothetical protein
MAWRTASPGSAILPKLTVSGRLRLAVEVISTYVEVRWRMRRGDVRSTVESLRRTPAAADSGLASYWQGVRLSKATTRTLRLLPSDTRCLMQSLVLLRLLARRGIASVLIVAVKSGPDFKAHAWVEHDARPLLPTYGYGRLLEL